MTFAKGGKVDDADVNSFISSVNNILTALGQTALSSGVEGSPVLASTWSSLKTAITNLASHQGTAISGLPAVIKGGVTAASSAFQTDVTAIQNFNAAAQGTTVTNFNETTLAWYNYVTFTQSVTFANATAATNYFNAGGQIVLQFLHPASTASIDALFNTLGTNCGSLVMSGHSSGSRTIAGTSYTGLQKVGGGGTAPTITTGAGYAGLTTTSTQIFKQIGGTFTGTSGTVYNQNFIQVNAYTSTNVTTGAVTINFVTTWDEVPNGLVTGAGSVNGRARTTTYLLFRPPATTYITNSWGTLTFAGSVAGQ